MLRSTMENLVSNHENSTVIVTINGRNFRLWQMQLREKRFKLDKFSNNGYEDLYSTLVLDLKTLACSLDN